MSGRVARRLSWVASLAVWGMALGVSLAAQGGPIDRQKVDQAAAMRGRSVYAAQCINCHGGPEPESFPL